jgi:hypothetical protein
LKHGQKWSLSPHLSPTEQRIQRGTKCLSPFGKPIVHLGWHLRVNRANHDAVSLQLTQLLREHLLRHAWNQLLQIGEVLNLTTEQMKKDASFQRPSSRRSADSTPLAAVSGV